MENRRGARGSRCAAMLRTRSDDRPKLVPRAVVEAIAAGSRRRVGRVVVQLVVVIGHARSGCRPGRRRATQSLASRTRASNNGLLLRGVFTRGGRCVEEIEARVQAGSDLLGARLAADGRVHPEGGVRSRERRERVWREATSEPVALQATHMRRCVRQHRQLLRRERVDIGDAREGQLM